MFGTIFQSSEYHCFTSLVTIFWVVYSILCFIYAERAVVWARSLYGANGQQVHSGPQSTLRWRTIHRAFFTVTWCLSPLFRFWKDLTYLSHTEVLVEPKPSASVEGLILERQKRAAQDMEPVQDLLPYLQDPCDPNPCQNDGVCVNVKGRASCRYHRPLPCLPWFSSEPNDAD